MTKTTIVTLATKEMAGVWELARRTWEPYCERHDYSLKIYTHLLDETLAPSWNKVLAVAEALHHSDGPVWWADADMVVVDAAVPVEGAQTWTNDLYISQDWNGLCCALFRAANTPWVRHFLTALALLGDVADPDMFGKGHGVKWEQNAIKLLCREFPLVKSHVGMLPRAWVNDQPERGKASDVFWHFGARSNPERMRMMRELHPLCR